VRVIAATNQDIPAFIEKGKFRADLWARLSGFVVRLPTLRARREDLGMLLSTLIAKLAPERAATIGLERASARAMLAYSWPLNVRELENLVRTSLALSPDRDLVLRELAAPSAESTPLADSMQGGPLHTPPTPLTTGAASTPPPSATAAATAGDDEPLSGNRKAAIEHALRAQRGNVAAAARMLGCSRGALHRWLRDLGIDADRYR
jgi:DNA-binding NtrC family response regulator